MTEIFNNREISIAFWMMVVFAFVIAKSTDFLSSAKSLGRSLFHYKIMAVYWAAVSYTAIGVYLLYKLDFWRLEQLKDTILWCIVAIFSTLLELSKIKEGEKYFRKALTKNIKYTIIVEFILNVYTFNLAIELFLVPLIIIMGFAQATADTKIKTPAVEKIANNFFVVFGLATIANTIYHIVAHFSDFASTKTLNDFILSPFLAIWILPFLFIVSLFSTYEEHFISIGFRIEDKSLLKYAKMQAIRKFNVDMKGLDRWRKSIYGSRIKTKEDVVKSIAEIKLAQQIEKAPPKIDLNDGWSPYSAKDFLKSISYLTDYYSKNPAINEWSSKSQVIKLDDELFSNQLYYRIKGSATIATKLELTLNVANSKNQLDTVNVFTKHSNILTLAALNCMLPEKIKDAIVKRKSTSDEFGNYIFELYYNLWDAKNKKFDMIFTIKHKSYIEFWETLLNDDVE